MRATSAAGPRRSRRPAPSGPGLPRGSACHRPLAARSRTAPPPRRAHARSYPARSRAAAASTAISCADIHQTYHRSGRGPAMRNSSRSSATKARSRPVSLTSPLPIPPISGGRPRTTAPAMTRSPGRTSCRATTTGTTSTRSAASTRVVIAVAAESSTMIASRAAVAGPDGSGPRPSPSPGGHDGSPGGEYGRTGDPDAFAATLRQVLTS
jgi:hypothetical protein